MGDFDEEARYDAEVAPLLRKLMEKCRELGLPMLALINFSQRGEDLGMIKAIPGNEQIAQRVPNIMRTVMEVYDAVSTSELDITGIRFVSGKGLTNGFPLGGPPTTPNGGQYLN